MTDRKEKRIYILLTILAAMSGLVWMFTNVGIDVTYQVTMAYRILKGDAMFLEMWEPHQTSAFLNVIFMWPYIKLTGTTTGIILYLQIIGILIRAVIAGILYRFLGNRVSKPLAYSIALLHFMVSPKDFAISEYGNMQVWFSTLLLICLIKYFEKNKITYSIASGIFTCLLVLSYPSCLLIYVAVIVLIVIYGEKNTKAKGILSYTLTCVAIGIGYILMILSKVDFETLLECIKGMLSIEPSHTENALTKTLGYLQDFGEIIACIAVGVTAAFTIEKLIKKIYGNKLSKDEYKGIFLLLSFSFMLIGFLINILSAENRCAYGLIFAYLIAVGLCFSNMLNGFEKRLYFSTLIISLTCFVATLLLTNLEMVVSLPYTVLAAGMSLIPIVKFFKKLEKEKISQLIQTCFLVLIVLFAFRALYIRTPILGHGQICTSFDNLALVRSGPAAGIITDEESAVRERDGYIDFAENVKATDRVMVIASPVNSLPYMYSNSNIAAPSIISTGYFGEEIIQYWEINEDKYPDVLAVASYGGELDYEIRANEWLYKWITEEYGATKVVNGTFWTFYYRQ